MINKKKARKVVKWVLALVFTTIAGLFLTDKYNDYVHSTEVVLSYGGHALDEDKPVDIYVAVGSAVTERDALLVPVNFSVMNPGDKPLSDIRITSHYNDKALCPPESILNFVSMRGNLIKGDVVFEPRYYNDGCEMAFALKALNPEKEMSLSGALMAKHVRPEHPYLGELPYTGEITVDVEASGAKRKSYHLKFHLVSRTDGNGLLSWYLNEYTKEKAIRERPDYSYVQYLWKVIFGRSMTSILVAPAYASLTQGNTTVWLPKDNHLDAKIAVYSPYSWSLL